MPKWIGRPHHLFALLSLGLFLLMIYFGLHFLGDPSHDVGTFAGSYLLLFAGYVSAILCLREDKSLTTGGLAVPLMLFLFSIGFRVVMVLSETHLSTDILRYMWDGMLLDNGVDPYSHVPSAPELDQFKAVSYYQSYDHKDEHTVYPPFAQMIFAGAYATCGNSLLCIKSLTSIADLMAGLFIVLLIRSMGGDNARAYRGALVYLWNPTVVIEFSNSGHVDSLAIFLLLLSLYFLSTHKKARSSVFLVLSVFLKWTTVLFLPAYARLLLRTRKAALAPVCWSVLVCALIVLPFYLSSGLGFAAGVVDFAKNWRFESALSRLFVYLFRMEGSAVVVASVLSYFIFVVAYLMVILGVDVHQAGGLVDCAILILCMFYLVVPVLYPWYAVWLVAMCALVRFDVRVWFSVALSGSVVVNYLRQFGGLSTAQFWFGYVLTFLPIVGIMVFYLAGSRNPVALARRVRRPGQPEPHLGISSATELNEGCRLVSEANT